MKKRILDYMSKIDTDIENYENDNTLTKEQLKNHIDKHLIQISFFQHERFIHLIVTFLFAIITIACVLFTVAKINLAIIILTVLSLVLLVPYVSHYYLLENNVQRMYKQYDKMIEILDKI